MKGFENISETLSADFINSKLSNLGLSLIGEYTGKSRSYDLVDKEGYKYFTKLDGIIYRNSPPQKFSQRNKYIQENLQNYISMNGSDSILLEDMNKFDFSNNSRNKVKMKCGLCGKTFYVAYADMKATKKFHCSDCTKQISAKKRKIPYSQAKEKVESFGLKLLTQENEYGNSVSPLKMIDEDGYLYQSNFANLNDGVGAGPLRYSPTNPYTIYNIQHFCDQNNFGCKLLSDQYINGNSLLLFQCKCGNKFTTSWATLQADKKYRCDICSKRKSTFEQEVETYLDSINVEFVSQFRINECRNILGLVFDIAVLDKDENILLLIELDGEQHIKPKTFGGISKEKAQIEFEQLQIRDEIKNQYCKDNHIPLLRIPYKQYLKKEYIQILDKTLQSLRCCES